SYLRLLTEGFQLLAHGEDPPLRWLVGDVGFVTDNLLGPSPTPTLSSCTIGAEQGQRLLWRAADFGVAALRAAAVLWGGTQHRPYKIPAKHSIRLCPNI